MEFAMRDYLVEFLHAFGLHVDYVIYLGTIFHVPQVHAEVVR